MRKRTLAQWKKAAWKVFSEYIRRRDKGVCFTCKRKKPWKEQDAGHYIPGSICGLALYFSESNVNCQCTYCNRFLHGNLSQYALNLQKKYGDGVLRELESIRRRLKGVIFTENDYKAIIEKYDSRKTA